MPAKGKAVVLGGGTFFHVRPHLALAAPAFGATADTLGEMLLSQGWRDVEVVKTAMAGGRKDLMTNTDVECYLMETVLKDPEVKLIVMSVALCDFEGSILQPDIKGGMTPTPSGKNQPRLQTAEGERFMGLTPAPKILSRIRKERKDIFLVGFKTTAGALYEEQYRAGLNLLKTSSCNLVFANDVHFRVNMTITPEQSVYGCKRDRIDALTELAQLITARANLTFTRSTVKEGFPLSWASDSIPRALREVVDYCIRSGAYKPFNGVTVGHFAAKAGPSFGENTFLTSIRRSDFNKLSETGLVMVEAQGDDQVIAYGAKPSVGGQSQRIVFSNHPDIDCIVHFHCPLVDNPFDNIPIRPQWAYECGSHECGRNTSDGLKDFGGGIKAVMLDQHGPNIVFNRNTDPSKVIEFIQANWNLSEATDGVLTA